MCQLNCTSDLKIQSPLNSSWWLCCIYNSLTHVWSRNLTSFRLFFMSEDIHAQYRLKKTCKAPKREHLGITGNTIYTLLYNNPLVFWPLCAFSNCIILLIYEDKKVHSLCLWNAEQRQVLMLSQESQRGTEIYRSLINYHRNNVKLLHTSLHEIQNGLEVVKICIFS